MSFDQKAYLRRYREENREALLAQGRANYAARREEILAQKREYYERNKELLREKARQRYRRNPKRVARINKRWERKSGKKIEYNRNRKALKRRAEGSFTQEEFLTLGCTCAYCGREGEVHPDHVIPLSRGGSNWISNIVPACPPCNTSKGAKTGDEFRAWIAAGRAA